MKAGLFLCDHVSPEYQDLYGDYSDMFAQLFPEFDWIYYDAVNGQFPENLEDCEVYFATGSRHSVYENLDWILHLKSIIRQINIEDKYFIGFCFGHQLLGEALGGKVEKSTSGWSVGVHDFKILESKSWMLPKRDSFSSLMMCQDQVVQLPKNALLLAGNGQCPNGMFQVGSKMLGIQAHPEFPKAYDRLLMEMRRNVIGDKIVNSGIRSLEKEIHKELIKDWIMNFVQNTSEMSNGDS